METVAFEVQWFGAVTAVDNRLNGGKRLTIGAYDRPEILPVEGANLLLQRPDGTVLKTKVEAVFQHSTTYSIVLPGLIQIGDVPRGTKVLLSGE